MKSVKNLPASVRQRLLNRAKIDNRAFSELVQYYAMERFLYRLSISAHSDRFILKGALMLRVWRSPEFRPTMDIDMLGITSNDEKSIVAQIRDIISVDAVPDGLRFDPESVQSERTAVDADYHGIRIRFRGTLENVRISMQVDIGFSDIIYPGPEEAELPTLLDFPAPKLLCYSRESAIAEKFEAMVKLGALNSRMKDFYDIWLLSRLFEFDGAKLAEAIRLTFARRGTELPNRIEAFDESFIASKQIQWTAFWKRLQHDHVPASFTDIVAGVKEFLEPPASGLLNSRIPKKWIASGPWT
jgi:hypothetical protein